MRVRGHVHHKHLEKNSEINWCALVYNFKTFVSHNSLQISNTK